MQTMTDLDDPSYLAEQGILLEEVDDIKEALTLELEKYRWEIHLYIEYKLKQRQESVILSNGISAQIKTLSERDQVEQRKIESADKWIDYVCKFAGITSLKNPMGEIKYTGWDKMKIADWCDNLLPEDLKERVFVTSWKTYLEDQQLRELWYKEVVKLAWLPEIKKWYKTISEKQKKELEGKIWIDDSKSISIK